MYMSIKRQKKRMRRHSKGIVMKRFRDRNIDLDAVDARILTALVADARVSVAELARFVGLSAPSAAERIKRLEESGIIEGYAASLDPRALGLKVAAWLRVRPVPGGLNTVADILRTLPESSNAIA